MKRRLPIGVELAGCGAHVRVWAPNCGKLWLSVEGPAADEFLLVRERQDGYFSRLVPGLGAGTRYRLRPDNDEPCADPASRFQPDGPFGPSQIVDPTAYRWHDDDWPGIAAPERQVIYEMHVGTFTPEGTWLAAADHLTFLAELGITTIELMPANDYAGTRGWGYDGVHLFAPTHNQGTPDNLRAFVDRAHACGLAVILDVVYNHFGPRGNTLFRFAPYRREGERTEWGDAVDYGNPGVRELFVANAAYWIDEYHFDGLRLDATQAMDDARRPHLIAEIVRAARCAALTRRVFVVGENEPQNVSLLHPIADGGCGLDALWNDDFEHSCRVALTGRTDGYLRDYRGRPQELLSALEHGFLYEGQVSAWQRAPRGTPTRGLSPGRFVHFLENHDQIANTGLGLRLTSLAHPGAYRALLAVLLLGPALPMLFQGQETGSARPWRYFADHGAQLDPQVRAGRARFLSQFASLATPAAQAALPDPADVRTFEECVLDPAERRLDTPLARLHVELLRLRRDHPAFTDQRADCRSGAVLGERAFCVRWWHEAGDRLLLVNLGEAFDESVLPEPLLAPPGRDGWRLAWSSEDPRYGGCGTPEPFTRAHLAIPGYSAVLCAPGDARGEA